MPTMFERLGALVQQISLPAMWGALLYPLRKAWTESRWTLDGKRRSVPAAALRFLGTSRRQARGRPSFHRWPRTWSSPGKVRYVRPHPRGVTLVTENATLEITFLSAEMVQVRYQPTDLPSTPMPSYAIAKPVDAWPLPELVRHELEDALLIQSLALVVGVRFDTAQVFFATPNGELLRTDVTVGWHRGGALRHRTTLGDDELLLGLGERTTPWNRRGRTHILWNTDPAGYTQGDDPINLNIPVYMSVRGSDDEAERTHCYLVFYENPTYAEFDLGASVGDVAEHRFTGGQLSYYFIAGSPATVMERYTELTGRHTLQPLWMLGYQQSRWSYGSESRVRRLVRDFHRYNVPCDVIHLDIDYMDGFRCFTWHPRRFRRPKRLAADLWAQGFKLITIIDPGIKRDPHYTVYEEGVGAGHFCTRPDGQIFHAPVWPGASAFPDFTDPATRAWWGELYRPLVETGIAGFWNDMNEPATFARRGDPTLPMTLRHRMEGLDASHAEVHNLYGLLMARATHEGLAALRPDARPVVITRSGWAGVQRYATSWTADNESTWDALRLTIPMILGLGLSGVGFTGPDVGGFIGAPDGELFTRWVQTAAFMPFFRAHTAKGFPDQEPWSYGEPFLSIIRRFIEFRYELLPYLYTAMWQMSTRGWPMVRPLAWSAPQRMDLWQVDDAFMCGDHLLVAPILEPGVTERQVRLPPGSWYAFWDNRRYAGDQLVSAYAALETLPLFVREGAVIPRGESALYVEARRERFLRLDVYVPQRAEATSSELYEDAGEGLAYQHGEFRHSRFVVRRTPDGFSISWTHDGAYEPPYEHVALTLNGLQSVPRQIWVDGEAYPVVQSDPVRHSVLLGIPPFERLDVIT